MAADSPMPHTDPSLQSNSVPLLGGEALICSTQHGVSPERHIRLGVSPSQVVHFVAESRFSPVGSLPRRFPFVIPRLERLHPCPHPFLMLQPSSRPSKMPGCTSRGLPRSSGRPWCGPSKSGGWPSRSEIRHQGGESMREML